MQVELSLNLYHCSLGQTFTTSLVVNVLRCLSDWEAIMEGNGKELRLEEKHSILSFRKTSYTLPDISEDPYKPSLWKVLEQRGQLKTKWPKTKIQCTRWKTNFPDGENESDKVWWQ